MLVSSSILVIISNYYHRDISFYYVCSIGKDIQRSHLKNGFLCIYIINFLWYQFKSRIYGIETIGFNEQSKKKWREYVGQTYKYLIYNLTKHGLVKCWVLSRASHYLRKIFFLFFNWFDFPAQGTLTSSL